MFEELFEEIFDELEKNKKDLKKYITLKNSVNEIIAYLDRTIPIYEDIGQKLSDIYLIDNDITSIYQQSIQIKNDIDETSKKLKNSIITKINAKINSLKNNISDLEENKEE